MGRKFSDLKTNATNKINTLTTSSTLTCRDIECGSNIIFKDTDTDCYQLYNVNAKFKITKDSANSLILINTENAKPLVINGILSANTATTRTFSILNRNRNFTLEVSSSVSATLTDSRYISSTATNTYTGRNENICAKFNSTIMCLFYFNVSSDKRIKTNIQDINDNSALQMIMKIEPKTYEYIDKFERGDKKVYGFIAQQIREVIPEAVNIQSEMIPNIYKMGTLDNSNIITIDTDISNIIKIDNDISLITSNLGKNEYKVTEVINSNQFKINKEIDDNSNVFVYGTKVNDFHILDKNYIFTLNVCATQELYKLININQSNINEINNKSEFILNNINLIKNKINECR